MSTLIFLLLYNSIGGVANQIRKSDLIEIVNFLLKSLLAASASKEVMQATQRLGTLSKRLVIMQQAMPLECTPPEKRAVLERAARRYDSAVPFYTGVSEGDRTHASCDTLK